MQEPEHSRIITTKFGRVVHWPSEGSYWVSTQYYIARHSETISEEEWVIDDPDQRRYVSGVLYTADSVNVLYNNGSSEVIALGVPIRVKPISFLGLTRTEALRKVRRIRLWQ